MIQLSSSIHLIMDLANPEIETSRPSHDILENTKTKPCILVVEDDLSVAGLLNTALENLGYHVLVTRNGREGLDVVAKLAVDGTLLDLQMPVLAMSGGLDLPALR